MHLFLFKRQSIKAKVATDAMRKLVWAHLYTPYDGSLSMVEAVINKRNQISLDN